MDFCINIYKGCGPTSFPSSIVFVWFCYQSFISPFKWVECVLFLSELANGLLSMSENIIASKSNISYLGAFTSFLYFRPEKSWGMPESINCGLGSSFPNHMAGMGKGEFLRRKKGFWEGSTTAIHYTYLPSSF